MLKSYYNNTILYQYTTYYIYIDKLFVVLRRIYPYSIYKAKKDIYYKYTLYIIYNFLYFYYYF